MLCLLVTYTHKLLCFKAIYINLVIRGLITLGGFTDGMREYHQLIYDHYHVVADFGVVGVSHSHLIGLVGLGEFEDDPSALHSSSLYGAPRCMLDGAHGCMVEVLVDFLHGVSLDPRIQH